MNDHDPHAAPHSSWHREADRAHDVTIESNWLFQLRRERFRSAIDELYEHIAKEEDGLFPASLTELDGEDWDTAIDAWHRAHPGQPMIDEAR